MQKWLSCALQQGANASLAEVLCRGQWINIALTSLFCVMYGFPTWKQGAMEILGQLSALKSV